MSNNIGVILEINPFHYGHKYFLETIKDYNPDSNIIAVVSSYTTQRGELSILKIKNKIIQLLRNKVDIVIFLPFLATNQSADYFALNSVKILNQFNIDKIICGSESNDINKIIDLYKKDNKKEINFKEGYLKNKLKNLKSNDILALSYYKAIQKINPQISLELLQRINNNYNDEQLSGKISSATAIRIAFNSNKNLEKYLDETSIDGLIKINNNIILKLLKYKLYLTDKEKLHTIALSENGELINKIFKIINNKEYKDYDEFLERLKDKNNSKYKYQRLILNIILDIHTKDIDQFNQQLQTNEENKYLVLGMSNKGKAILNKNNSYFFKKKDINNLYKIDERIEYIINNLEKINNKLFINKPYIIGEKNEK